MNTDDLLEQFLKVVFDKVNQRVGKTRELKPNIDCFRHTHCDIIEQYT